MSEEELDVTFADEPVYVDLEVSLTQRMWDLTRAVASGHGDSGLLQAEAVHLVADIKKVLGDI